MNDANEKSLGLESLQEELELLLKESWPTPPSSKAPNSTIDNSGVKQKPEETTYDNELLFENICQSNEPLIQEDIPVSKNTINYKTIKCFPTHLPMVRHSSVKAIVWYLVIYKKIIFMTATILSFPFFQCLPRTKLFLM